MSLSIVPSLFIRLLAEEKYQVFSERNCPQLLVAKTSFINEAHVSYLFSLFLFALLSRRIFGLTVHPRGEWNMYSICFSLRTSKGFSNINNFFKHERGNVAFRCAPLLPDKRLDELKCKHSLKHRL